MASGSEGNAQFDARVRALEGNPDVTIERVDVLSDDWYVLRRVGFAIRQSDGEVDHQSREAYDRGNGVTILLYDPSAGTVLLTRQFRLPAYVNGHPDGMLIEAAAGLLDEEGEHPEEAVRREVAEETGVEIGKLELLWRAYMSPGSVTEHLTFFAATYASESRSADDGGGVADEGEDIEVVELALADALAKIGTEIVDAKTIMLLQWVDREGRLAG